MESFNSFPKHNAISEHLSFLRRVCVQNEVTVIHKFSRCEIRFVGRFSLEKLKIYETCNFHVNLDLQDL